MANRWGNNETVTDFIFGGSKITADGDCSHEIKRCLLLGRKTMTNLDSILKKQRHYFANKCPSSQSYGFFSSHIWIWELDQEESWVLKNWCFWTVVLEKTLESPWTARRSNQSILKEINPECSLEGLMLKLKLQYIGHLMWRTDSIGKNPDAGKDWRQEEKGMADEMLGWRHRLNGHEFEQAPGVGDGQGGLACCSPWGHKESDTTERLIWTEMKHTLNRYLLNEWKWDLAEPDPWVAVIQDKSVWEKGRGIARLFQAKGAVSGESGEQNVFSTTTAWRTW